MPMGDKRQPSIVLPDPIPPPSPPRPPSVHTDPRPPGSPGMPEEPIYLRMRVWSCRSDNIDLEEAVNFPVRSLCIDNDGSQWLWVPACSRFVAPYTRGAVLPMPAGQDVKVTVTAPKGFIQPALKGSFAVYATEAMFQPSCGFQLQASMQL